MIGKTKLFISSYSYRWAMGCRQYRPLNPMPIKEFLAKAKGHGLDGIQIVDNVNPENLTQKECKEIFAVAQKLGIELQWGFEGWEENKIDRLLEICSIVPKLVIISNLFSVIFPLNLAWYFFYYGSETIKRCLRQKFFSRQDKSAKEDKQSYFKAI